MDPDLEQHVAHELSSDREIQKQAAKERIARGERPWEESRGIQSVVDAVRDLDFPNDVEHVVEEAGDRMVWVTGELQIPLRRALGKLKGDDAWPSLKDFHATVQRHWQGIRNLEVPAEQWPPASKRPRTGS